MKAMTISNDGLMDPKKDNRWDGDLIPPKQPEPVEPGKRIPLND